MTNPKSKPIIEAFFDRLIEQQASLKSAQDLYRRQVQIFCGRWLALRRLGLNQPLDQLAKATGLTQQTIVFIETGLAEASQAPEPAWRLYCQELARQHNDSLWIWMVLLLALGRIRVPSERVMMRVLDDLKSIYDLKPTPALELPVPPPSAETTSSVVSPWALISRWINKSVYAIRRQLSGPLELSVYDVRGANMLKLGAIAYRDLSDAALIGDLPNQAAIEERCGSTTQLSLLMRYLSADTDQTLVNIGRPDASRAGQAHRRAHAAAITPRAEWLDQVLLLYTRLMPHALGRTAPSWHPRISGGAGEPEWANMYISLTTDGPPRPIRRLARAVGATAAYQRGTEALGQADIAGHARARRSSGRVPEPALITLACAETAEQAIRSTSRLLLFGPPGSGKTLTLHMAMLRMAQALRDSDTLPSDQAVALRVPIYCSLGAIADTLGPDEQLSGARLLRKILDAQPLVPGAPHHHVIRSLRAAATQGHALLLLDGLGELPAGAEPPGHNRRTQIIKAIRSLARILPAETQIVVTGDADLYEQWRYLDTTGLPLPAGEGWNMRALQPLTGEQVRTLIKRWFGHTTPPPEQSAALLWGDQHATALISRLAQDCRLQALCAAPLALALLLSMLAKNDTADLPGNRAQLYDRYITLTLNALPEADLARFAMPFSIVHAAEDTWATLVMRRSGLQSAAFELLMRTHSRAGAATQAHTDQIRALQQIFPHTSLHTFLAACHLAVTPKLVQRAYAFWQSTEDERGQELMLLLAGRLNQLGSTQDKLVPWLASLLASTDPSQQPKSLRQIQRDALLAADSYAECGGRAGLGGAEIASLPNLERAIAGALVHVLAPEPLAATAERLRAGTHLGVLGDPRLGVCTTELALCTIAGPSKPNAREAIRIGRHPITNAQWAEFMHDGGYDAPEWWGDSWQLRLERRWVQPLFWDVGSFNQANQPVVGVSSYEAQAFCAWLTQRGRRAGWLGDGEYVRLPSLSEWQRAAYGADGRVFPWGDRWRAGWANTRELRAERPTPVGCFPQAASTAGALDMSGNVAEWCECDLAAGRSARCYRCGGSWAEDADQARRGAERECQPDTRGNMLGFRVAIAPVD